MTKKGLTLINDNCKVCNFGPELIDWTLSKTEIARQVGCHRESVSRHIKHSEDPELRVARSSPPEGAQEPAGEWIPRRKWETPQGEVLNSYQFVPAGEGDLPWPVIDRPAPLRQTRRATPALNRKWKTCVVGADTQIGFRALEDGTLDPFHDESALALFNTIVEIENPDRVVVAGDILDLPEQGRFAQEASFARTTQLAIDRTYEWVLDMREKTTGEIDLIEGNHDKRLQNFVEANALAAFGLRKASWPDSWPVMSLPYLLRLDELDVTYHDSYPNAHVWINNQLRAEHGTKANSRGSTAQRYLDETPHVSRVVGHSHRQEVVQRTTWDRVGRIRSQVINPGCLCRVDGAVPSVNGSVGANGKPATVYEDWQQGAAVIRYTEDEFFVELVQFDGGRTLYRGVEYLA